MPVKTASMEKTEKTVTLKLQGVTDGAWQAEVLDSENTMTPKTVSVKDGELSLTMPSDCVILLKSEASEGTDQ